MSSHTPKILNQMDKKGRTLLDIALEHNSIDCINFLIANNAKTSIELKAGKQVSFVENYTFETDEQTEKGITPVHDKSHHLKIYEDIMKKQDILVNNHREIEKHQNRLETNQKEIEANQKIIDNRLCEIKKEQENMMLQNIFTTQGNLIDLDDNILAVIDNKEIKKEEENIFEDDILSVVDNQNKEYEWI